MVQGLAYCQKLFDLEEQFADLSPEERYEKRLELSNNRAEWSIKPFVIGRKNFLFANTLKGAKGSAIMFSLIQTAIENGLDPLSVLDIAVENRKQLRPKKSGCC